MSRGQIIAVKTWLSSMRRNNKGNDFANEFIDAAEVLMKDALRYEWHDLKATMYRVAMEGLIRQ